MDCMDNMDNMDKLTFSSPFCPLGPLGPQNAGDTWLDFVLANRKDVDFDHKFDLVCALLPVIGCISA